MGPAVECDPDFVCERADVGSLAAPHADLQPGEFAFEDLHLVDMDKRLPDGNLLSGPGEFIGASAVDLLGGVYGRGLEPLSGKFRQGFFDGIAGDVLPGIGLVDFVFEVVAGGRSPEHDIGNILLLLGLEGVDHLGCASDADEQDARSQGVEGPGVPDLDASVPEFPERELDLAHDIGGGPPQGFVQDGDVPLLEIDAAEFLVFAHQKR